MPGGTSSTAFVVIVGPPSLAGTRTDGTNYGRAVSCRLTESSRSIRLNSFAKWVGDHLTGDEKGEAQIFLDRLFQAFGWPGLREAGATCELRLKKDSTGGTAFADLVWKPVVVIEMKKRGADLSRHYRHAFDYWAQLAPGRPRYAVLCNFDEFWVYDFETQMDTPVDMLTLAGLSDHYGPLAFLFPGDEAPTFGNHQENVTRQAADQLAVCFNSLVARGVDRPIAQRFILQTLMALFAEDIGLLEKYFFTRLLNDCKTPTDSYDMLGGLFEAMNTPNGVHGGRFKGVAYFASSAESVGRFWFRESSQVVIKGNFHSLVGTKAVGSSGNHSDFVVETLNGAIGDFSFGSKPIQDQRLMGA